MLKAGNFLKVIFLLFIIALGFQLFNSRPNEIDVKGRIIIGKLVNRDKWGKYKRNYFVFYINNQKKKCFESYMRPPNSYNSIGKFYKIKYLDKYPDAIHPLFDQEVTDTIELLKAGFSMDEILNKKENNLFP